MPTIAERFAEFNAQRQAASPPVEKEEVDTAGPVAGDVASAFQRFQAGRKEPADLGASWKAKNKGTFQRSLDADTVDVSRGKVRQATRLAGIDAPESGQALGPAAHAYLDELVKGQTELKPGSKTKDRYGRDVSTLYAGEKNLSVELVRAGYAKPAYQKGLSAKMQQELASAADEAREAGKGVWSPDYVGEDPEAFRHRQGRQNAGLGHDNRSPLDPSTLTISQHWANFQAKRGGGEAPSNHSGGLAKGPVVQAYFDKFKPDYEEQKAVKEGISRKDQYVKEEGWLDRVFGALDYAGNVSRSTIKGAIEGGLDKATQYAEQAAGKRRYTSATSLRDAATKKAGMEAPLRLGVDDGKFSIGDVGDFALDLATDIFTDPMTAVTAGFGSIAKGGKLAKALPTLHQGAVEAKLGMKTPAAIKYAKTQVATRAAIGAVYGVGVTDGDEDLSTKLLAAGAGAALGASTGKGLDKASALFKTGFNRTSDWYAETTRGSKFADFSKSRDLFMRGVDKVRNIAVGIEQGRFQALKGLGDADKVKVVGLMGELKTEFLRRRKILEEKVLQIGPEHPAYNRVMNNFNRRIEQGIEREFLPGLLEREEKHIADAVVAWGNHNESVISKLNREVFGLEHGKPDLKTGEGIVGVRWHMDDVYEKSNFKEAGDLLGRAQIFKATKLKRSDTALKIAIADFAQETGNTIDQKAAKALLEAKDPLFTKVMANATDKSYAAYADKFSKVFLDNAERKAMKFMAEYSATGAKQGGVRGLEHFLGGFDKVTNFMKANMLYFSMSWIKNNYMDNLAKSFIENGTQGLLDAASFGKLRAGVTDDVSKLYKNQLKAAKSSDLMEALEHGVLDNPMFKSINDKSTRAFLYTPEQVKASTSKYPLDLFRKAGEIWLSNPYVKMVGSVGSHMEGTARLMTYIRTKEALLSSPLFKNAGPKELAKVKEMAADVVKKTFFDYGDVTHFESAVFKRLVPFYSFYSKNLPYWLKAVYDPEKVGRVLALEKARRNVGEDPSSFDKSGMTPYLLDNGARKLGHDEKGRTQYGIFPSGSMYDAAKMVNPLEWAGQLVEKGHPIPKAAYELATGNDLFDGQKLYPSQSEGGKKFLFSRGFKYRALPFDTGVEVDEGGNPYTKSDTLVTVDKIMSTLWPHGAIDQVAGSAGKIASGKETLGESIRDRLSPMQTVKVSESYARMVRQQKREKSDGKKDGK